MQQAGGSNATFRGLFSVSQENANVGREELNHDTNKAQTSGPVIFTTPSTALNGFYGGAIGGGVDSKHAIN